MKLHDGREMWLDVSVSVLRHRAELAVLSAVRDVTERKLTLERARWNASHARDHSTR